MQTNEPPILVCFAVKEEAKPFDERLASDSHVRTLLTGIGPRNAERAIRAALREPPPGLVLTCGFAGGLNPELKTGTVLFSTDDTEIKSQLLDAGARPARFFCAEKVVATAQAKRDLWQTTGADAVEMESEVIRRVCRAQKIPSATVRVILDPAAEDLPLDFNRLLTADQRLHFGRLALALMTSPGRIGALLRFQRQVKAAAEILAQVLAKIIPG